MKPGRDSQRKRALQDLIGRLMAGNGPLGAASDAMTHPLMVQARADWARGQIADFISLKALTALAARHGDADTWLRLLATFDPALPIDAACSKPQLGGLGPGALNSGREVLVNGERRYQKIYLGTSRCFQRMRHAYRHILEPMQPVPFPPVRRYRSGQKLVAVEFAFVDGLNPGRAVPDLALAAARRLGSVQPPGNERPRWHVDRYPLDLRFAQSRLLERDWGRGSSLAQRLKLPRPLQGPVAALISRLGAEDRVDADRLSDDLARWSARLEAAPRVFSHGDLNRANLTGTGLIIDWDNAGWRVYGHDAAYAAAFHTDVNDLASVLALSAAQVERPGHAVTDRFAFVLFLLHHLPAVGPRRMTTAFARDLIAALNDLETRLDAVT